MLCSHGVQCYHYPGKGGPSVEVKNTHDSYAMSPRASITPGPEHTLWSRHHPGERILLKVIAGEAVGCKDTAGSQAAAAPSPALTHPCFFSTLETPRRKTADLAPSLCCNQMQGHCGLGWQAIPGQLSGLGAQAGVPFGLHLAPGKAAPLRGIQRGHPVSTLSQWSQRMGC